VLFSATVAGLTLLIVRPAYGRDAGQAANSSGTVHPVDSTAMEAQEKLHQRAGSLVESANLAEAEGLLNSLLAQTDGPIGPILTLKALKLRGNVRARMGKFQEAARDMEQVVQSDQGDHDGWQQLALALAKTGDLARYRHHCKEMLHFFRDTTDPVTATQIAKSCLVMPSALDAEDVVLAERLADAAVALTPPRAFFPWRGMTMGLAEYRRGEFARATKIIDRIAPAAGEGGPRGFPWRCDALFISAMAHQQLKETGKARAALDQGRELARATLPALDSQDLGAAWWDVLFANILMAEAGKSIEAATPARP
jgi:tetratricopeptide (TPR) repeat protein